MDKRHTEGQICEIILEEYLLKLGMYVFRPNAAQGPVDVVAIDPKGGIYLFDAKKDAERVNPGRTKPARIYRVLSPVQRLLGVRMAYVDLDTREVCIVPALPELEK